MMRRTVKRTLKAAAFALLVLSCEGDELPPPGQLMLVFNTDMKLPEDVSSVVLEVTSFGSTLFSNEYEVGAGKLLMPSTFGIVVGEDPTTPVRIRLIGFQKNEPRVLREVVTTVPEDRVAMLRMPIQWLCEGTAVSDGTGIDPKDAAAIKTTCGAEETCVAGTCASVDIDSSKLPDYSAAAVFGGGSGPGEGSCFDTLACFSSGETAVVEESGCTLADPGGDVNVALVLPAGDDGICDAQRCLIPLDGDSELGWERREGNIALPQAVCRRIAEGRIVGVEVSADCPTKTDANPTCGPWSSVGGGEGGGGTGGSGDGGSSVCGFAFGLVEQVAEVASPGALEVVFDAMDGDVVYVGETDGPASGLLTKWVPNDAGGYDMFMIAETPENPRSLQVNPTQTAIYLAAGIDAILEVTPQALPGEEVRTIASADMGGQSVALLGNDLFWTNDGEAGQVFRYPLLDGSPVPVGYGTKLVAVVADENDVFWADAGSGTDDGLIVKFLDGATAHVADNQAKPMVLAVNDRNLYWWNVDDKTVYSANKDGVSDGDFMVSAVTSAPEEMVVDMVADQSGVYWATGGTGMVRYADDTGCVGTLGDGLGEVSAVALSETMVYFANRSNGLIGKFPKPGGGASGAGNSAPPEDPGQ